MARSGTLVVDTRDADHEAGDLLQAGLNVSEMPTLGDVVRGHVLPARAGPVFFKSCGWAGWDLAAARCAVGARDGADGHADAVQAAWPDGAT